jgi:hypothetical protein
MKSEVTLFGSPFDPIPVALARVASSAGQDEIAWVAGTVLSNGMDVVDLKARGLFVAPKASSLLGNTKGFDIGLGVRPRKATFLGATVGSVANLSKIAANCNGLRLAVGENRSFV